MARDQHYKFLFLKKKSANNPQWDKDKRSRALAEKKKCVEAAGGKCSVCGYDKNLAALEFNHIRGEKKFDLSVNNFRSKSRASIEAELQKCELLCANCHREYTHPQHNNWKDHGQD